jgi:hypothetical protein
LFKISSKLGSKGSRIESMDMKALAIIKQKYEEG